MSFTNPLAGDTGLSLTHRKERTTLAAERGERSPTYSPVGGC